MFLALLAFCRLAGPELQRDAPVAKAFDSAFEVTIAVDRLPRRYLGQMSSEALEICCTGQPSIQSRRRNFQQVRAARHNILDVENSADVPAQICAIFVRDALRFVDGDTQHARLAAAAKLHVD